MNELQEKIHPEVGVLVRSNGEVFIPATSHSKAHWTFGNCHRSGYRRVRINGVEYLVHRLVAGTFLDNPENLEEVDHINRNPSDNRVENLRWVSHSDNQRNTSQNDRVEARGGTHLYEDERQYRREKSARWCNNHKTVMFSDGKTHWVGNDEAVILLAMPVNQRILKE